jgi:nicotinamidase-related amidase
MERVLPAIVDYSPVYRTNGIHALYQAARCGGPAGQMAPLFYQMEMCDPKPVGGRATRTIPALRRFALPATVIEKRGYSAFAQSDLSSFLQEKNVSTVILTGAETDVCVLSTVLERRSWSAGRH